jgi:hypothetical protein
LIGFFCEDVLSLSTTGDIVAEEIMGATKDDVAIRKQIIKKAAAFSMIIRACN